MVDYSTSPPRPQILGTDAAGGPNQRSPWDPDLVDGPRWMNKQLMMMMISLATLGMLSRENADRGYLWNKKEKQNRENAMLLLARLLQMCEKDRCVRLG